MHGGRVYHEPTECFEDFQISFISKTPNKSTERVDRSAHSGTNSAGSKSSTARGDIEENETYDAVEALHFKLPDDRKWQEQQQERLHHD